MLLIYSYVCTQHKVLIIYSFVSIETELSINAFSVKELIIQKSSIITYHFNGCLRIGQVTHKAKAENRNPTFQALYDEPFLYQEVDAFIGSYHISLSDGNSGEGKLVLFEKNSNFRLLSI